MSEYAEKLADIDKAAVAAFCGGREETERLVAWMDALVAENVALQADLVESADERRMARLAHYASQISAYRRIRNAAERALAELDGKPPAPLAPESTEGAVL